MLNFVKIKETCLYMHDLEKARHFYHDVLELPVIHYLPEKHLFLRVGSSVLLCFNPEDSKTKVNPPAHYGGGKQHFAFEIPFDEYDEAKDKIRAKDIKITALVTWKSGIESFYFEDPEGNVLEVVPDKGIWE